MITYKPIIIPGGRRKDGTWPVKIRVTFKGVSRRLPTTLVCLDSDLTRGGKIKNATVLERAGELIARMRETTSGLSPFTLDVWSVDDVVNHIRTRLSPEEFRLDFIAYGERLIAGKKEHTRLYYQTALNAIVRFTGCPSLDVNAITRPMLREFAESVGEVRAARHLKKLGYIHWPSHSRTTCGQKPQKTWSRERRIPGPQTHFNPRQRWRYDYWAKIVILF